MYRFRYLFPFLLIAFSLQSCVKKVVTGCPTDAVQIGALEKGEYRLRLIFSGLVTFLTSDKSENPEEVWVLIGNAKDPLQLKVGKNIPSHMSHLLIPEEVQVTGRGIEQQAVQQHIHDFELPGNWRAIDLSNESFTLAAQSRDQLRVVRNVKRLPHPCIPGIDTGCTEQDFCRQSEDFEWTVDIDHAISLVPPGAGEGPDDRKMKSCLTDANFCQDTYPLLAARLKITQGRVATRELLKKNQKLELYNFGPKFQFDSRAIAKDIVVDLRVTGPVKLQSMPLLGGEVKEPIVISGTPGQTVELRFVNHPDCGEDCAVQFPGNDFLFTFNYLNNPLFTDLASLPAPERESDGDSTWDGQCSPGSATIGGS